MKILRKIESLLLILGVLGISIFLLSRFHAEVSSRAALASFKAHQSSPIGNEGEKASRQLPVPQPQGVDFSLWSSKRILDFQSALTQSSDPPSAVLRVPKIHLEVPVFEGTDELNLNRGVGRIIGTSKPGQPGNVGIAGHRDGFFRGLKDVQAGDAVELSTLQVTQQYVVDQIQIVKPEDISVLADRGFPALTLVTCYPFYFIGDAPERYIVKCTLKGDRPAR
jgi:sortase A